ncbi:MAG: NADH-quinone oxidoreductase subunit D [Bacteroidetes bacterium]|nr:NADH-quinone oxidoreductase subunit D [Bacteroidota bacterium]
MRTAELRTEEFLLNVGPQHPSTHGVLRLVVSLDGEVITQCDPDLGYLHRTFEKISENRTYQQIVPFTDRMDYLGSMNANWGVAVAVEQLAGIEVPERAEYLRVIVAELNRIASHLMWMGAFGADVGAVTAFLFGFREREMVLDMFEEICGSRLTYGYIRVGGVAEDITPRFVKLAQEFLDLLPSKLNEYHDLLTGNPIFKQRTKGVGVITLDEAIRYGVTGPMLRSCGFPWDLRKDEPYSIYERFDFDIPVYYDGDCFDRYRVRMDEIGESAKIVRQALEGLPEGDFKVKKLARNIKPPVGDVYVRQEAPRGEYGVYMESDGTIKPNRVKYRTPSFSNLSILALMTVGWKIADLVAILGSVDIVLGDVDR